MLNYFYEPHIMDNPQLPFILHKDMVTSSTTAGFNWHTNIEILYCIKGTGFVSIDDKDIAMTEGCIVVVNSNKLHRVFSDKHMEYHVLIADHVFCEENGIPTDEILFEECISDEKLCRDFDNVLSRCDLRGRERTAAVRHAVLGMLIRLYRDHTVSENAERESSVTIDRIKSVIRYIRQNLENELSLDEIAAHVGVSKFHLAREFKRFSGQTVFEHINAVRCKEAKRLIETGMSVSAAAMSCGFENMSYFSRTYKKYTGLLPSDVRKRGKSSTTDHAEHDEPSAQ